MADEDDDTQNVDDTVSEMADGDVKGAMKRDAEQTKEDMMADDTDDSDDDEGDDDKNDKE